MKDGPILTPRGAARRLLKAWQDEPDHDASSLDHLLDALARHSHRHEIGPEHVFLAAEMASYPRALSLDARRALTLLILTSLLALEQGSTFIPVLGPEGREHLRDRFQLLLDGPCEEEQAATLAARDSAAVGALLTRGDLDMIVGTPGAHRPFILDGERLYHQRAHLDEIALARALAQLLRRPRIPRDDDDIRAALRTIADDSSGPVLLTDEQTYAILTALHSPFSIISGGPGTGKTTIVVSLLRIFFYLGLEVEQVALAAPTGKAARRLENAISAQLGPGSGVPPLERRALSTIEAPATLHRLLGYSPLTRRVTHDATNPLPHRLVIVDEASMVDLGLMVRLVLSVGPEAHLVLLGDAEQLPSVSAGAVLRDLVPPHPRRDAPWAHLVEGLSQPDAPLPAEDAAHPMRYACARIERSFRMDPRDPAGRNILLAARAIAGGRPEDVLGGEGDAALKRRDSVTSLQHRAVELLEIVSDGGLLDRPMLGAFIDRWYRERVAGHADHEALSRHVFHPGEDGFDEDERLILSSAFHVLSGFKLLCLTRSGPLGTAAINAALHARAIDGTGLSPRIAFAPGEPVMMLRNDYTKQLFNGAQGLIIRVALDERERATGDRRSHRFMACFPREDGFAVFHLEALRADLELAYAITVHKSQGSEFDAIALMLPTEDLPLLTREMLYTAITRSRKSALIVGHPDILRTGALRRVERFSSVAARLSARLARGDAP